MTQTTQHHEFPATVAECVQLLLSTFPPPILWAYEGAHLHLVAEVFDLYPFLLAHVEQRDSRSFFRDLARVSAVLLEDIEHGDPDDPDAEVLSAISGISRIMMRAGLKQRPNALTNGRFSEEFYRCAHNWDLDCVARLLQSLWDWTA